MMPRARALSVIEAVEHAKKHGDGEGCLANVDISHIKSSYPFAYWACFKLKVTTQATFDKHKTMWKMKSMNFPEWLAPFHADAMGCCLRLNHMKGLGCSKDACNFKHTCILCNGRHGAFAKDLLRDAGRPGMPPPFRCNVYLGLLEDLLEIRRVYRQGGKMGSDAELSAAYECGITTGLFTSVAVPLIVKMQRVIPDVVATPTLKSLGVAANGHRPSVQSPSASKEPVPVPAMLPVAPAARARTAAGAAGAVATVATSATPATPSHAPCAVNDQITDTTPTLASKTAQATTTSASERSSPILSSPPLSVTPSPSPLGPHMSTSASSLSSSPASPPEQPPQPSPLSAPPSSSLPSLPRGATPAAPMVPTPFVTPEEDADFNPTRRTLRLSVSPEHATSPQPAMYHHHHHPHHHQQQPHARAVAWPSSSIASMGTPSAASAPVRLPPIPRVPHALSAWPPTHSGSTSNSSTTPPPCDACALADAETGPTPGVVALPCSHHVCAPCYHTETVRKDVADLNRSPLVLHLMQCPVCAEVHIADPHGGRVPDDGPPASCDLLSLSMFMSQCANRAVFCLVPLAKEVLEQVPQPSASCSCNELHVADHYCDTCASYFCNDCVGPAHRIIEEATQGPKHDIQPVTGMYDKLHGMSGKRQGMGAVVPTCAEHHQPVTKVSVNVTVRAMQSANVHTVPRPAIPDVFVCDECKTVGTYAHHMLRTIAYASEHATMVLTEAIEEACQTRRFLDHVADALITWVNDVRGKPEERQALNRVHVVKAARSQLERVGQSDGPRLLELPPHRLALVGVAFEVKGAGNNPSTCM
eukprot:m.101017 g.101017  ORF g.101017 m.101017 type:complete len:816 (-) comp10372_c0_seq3:1304-3751(-)